VDHLQTAVEKQQQQFRVDDDLSFRASEEGDQLIRVDQERVLKMHVLYCIG